MHVNMLCTQREHDSIRSNKGDECLTSEDYKKMEYIQPGTEAARGAEGAPAPLLPA
jgi:hypothetical protein